MSDDRLQPGLKGRGGAACKRSRVVPRVEGLEDRLTPAGNFISDPALYQVVAEAPVLSRLDRFVPSAAPAVSDWVSVAADDPSLDPGTNGGDTNIYVVAHGWAPGFRDMVLQNGSATDPLKWWETLDTFLPASPGAPASPEMFYGSVGGGIQISPTGLAYALTQADPKAVVLAYSWIDDSATPDLIGPIPEEAGLSEAYTALNGQRLANALQEALPSTFHADNGKLHLIGHSHGSKVATVATLALNRTGDDNFQVAQLTILDSPEVDSFGVREDNAANNLWYFLGGVDISHTSPTASQTFVDHVISEFDEPVGPIQGFDPFDTTQTTDVLQQIVDVNLKGDVILSSFDFGGLHGYAFNWYAGGSQAWAQNPTPMVADQWSPLIDPANLPADGSYTQSWTESTQPQFALTAGPASNNVSNIPGFTDVSFLRTDLTTGASYDAGTGDVNLTEDGSGTASFTGEFKPESGLDGISFQYQFTNVGQGDQLVISADTGLFFAFKIAYVMTGTVAGTTAGVGTISLTNIAGSLSKHDIKIQLMPAPGSTGAAVTISHLQQFSTRLSDEGIQDAATAGRYAAIVGQPTGNREIATFTDPDPNAVATDFETQVDWGGAVDGTPTISVVPIGVGPNGSTWQVVGNAVYDDVGTYTVNVDIRDTKIGTRISAGAQKTFVVTPDAASRFVQSLYLNVLGRAGSTGEVNGWVGAIAAGLTNTQVASAFEHSVEARDHLVATWYQQYLGRTADTGEQQFWGNQLIHGASEESVLSQILGSDEFYARSQSLVASGTPDERFVQSLYQSLLNRVGNSDEVTYWISVLPALGRQGVAMGFLTSTEYRQVAIDADYSRLLHRPSDPGGAAFFLNLWNSGQIDAIGIRVRIEGSGEYYVNG